MAGPRAHRDLQRSDRCRAGSSRHRGGQRHRLQRDRRRNPHFVRAATSEAGFPLSEAEGHRRPQDAEVRRTVMVSRGREAEGGIGHAGRVEPYDAFRAILGTWEARRRPPSPRNALKQFRTTEN